MYTPRLEPKARNQETNLKKSIHRDSTRGFRLTNRSEPPLKLLLYDHYSAPNLCLLIRTSTHFTSSQQKKGKKHDFAGPSRHEAKTAEANPGSVGRGEQGEARPGNSAPRGGPQLELFRRRLKTWSQLGLLIAEMTGPTYLYILSC